MGYSWNHQRTRAARGKASEYACEQDCGRQATQWAQTHGTSGESPADYRSLCRSCHAKYDRATPPLQTGRKPTNASLTDEDVIEVRRRLTAGDTGYAIAKEFAAVKQVPFANMKRTVYQIRAGRNYVTVKGGQ